MFSIEASHFPSGFTFDGLFFQGGTFIASDFALPDAELGFEFPAFPIQLEDDQRSAFDLAFAIKFVDFLTVQQKFADTLRGGDFVTGFFIRLNVCVIEESFAVLDSRKGVADVGFADTDGFNFAAFQLNAGFVALENVKIAKRLAIKDRLGWHDRVWKRDGRLRVLGTFERLKCELACDDFPQGDIGQRHARGRFNHRSVSETELANALGDNVDQELLIWNYLSGFLEELSRHRAQGCDGTVGFRRELKNDRRAHSESGGSELRCDHKNGAVTLRAVENVVKPFVSLARANFSLQKSTANRSPAIMDQTA